MTDEYDLDWLVEATVAGAPELSPAQLDHLRGVLAPHLHLLATPAPVVELPNADEATKAPRRAAA